MPSASTPTLRPDRKSTRLNSSHLGISYAVFCLKKNTKKEKIARQGLRSDAQTKTVTSQRADPRSLRDALRSASPQRSLRFACHSFFFFLKERPPPKSPPFPHPALFPF